MAKKTEEKVQKVEVVEIQPAKVFIQPLSFDLGRDDLNLLKNKINEIIEVVNR